MSVKCGPTRSCIIYTGGGYHGEEQCYMPMAGWLYVARVLGAQNYCWPNGLKVPFFIAVWQRLGLCFVCVCSI